MNQEIHEPIKGEPAAVWLELAVLTRYDNEETA